jgi:hypothetical protein
VAALDGLMNNSNYYTLNPEVNLIIKPLGFNRRFRAITSLNKHIHYWEILDIDWARINAYMENVYNHIGEGILHQNRPVIWSVVDKTMTEYTAAVLNVNGDGKLNNYYRLAVIVNTIISTTVKLLSVTLSDRSGHSWNLLSDRTACEVLNADDPLTATPLTQAEITEARRLLISLLHDRYLDILTGTKYEDAIVADTLPRRY